MNKKAVAEFIVIIWSYLLFVGFALFFLILFSVSLRGCHNNRALQDISSDASWEARADIILLNYLRTDAEIDNKKTGITDLFLASGDEGCKFTGFSYGVFRPDPNQKQQGCGKEAGKEYDSEKLIAKSKEIFDPLFVKNLWYVEVSHPDFKTEDGFDFNVVFPYNEEEGIIKGQDNKELLSNRCNLKFRTNEENSVIATNATIPIKEGTMMVVLGFCRRA